VSKEAELGGAATVTTPDDCVAFVERVGFCSWRRYDKLPGLPSLEEATPWRGSDMTFQTWFWKDDLHTERRLFYAPLLAPDTPAFASLAFLPYLIAAQGDNDPRTLYEKGRLASNALRVYEHVERSGPTATNALPWPPGSRMLYLTALQQRFLLTKHSLTGRTRGTYGYRWCLCEEAFPDAFAVAGRISVADARAHVIEHLRSQGADGLTSERAARLFRWSDD
jgi:hypothetical protein